jgi:L-arabinokinase
VCWASERRQAYIGAPLCAISGLVGSLVAYVSGHGFGHAVRVCEVLRALRAREPDVRIQIRSPLARWFFAFNLGDDVDYAAARLDVGVVQADSLSVDLTATADGYGALEARREALLAAEAAALQPLRPALILADIPALAFAVAERLGVPGVAMANFSWDWIYADYVDAEPRFAPLVERLRDDYGRATLLLRLPLYGEMSAFPRIRDLPFVARAARLPRAPVRERLGLPTEERVVLVSFGGLGLDLARVPKLAGVHFVSTGGTAHGDGPAGCRIVSHDEMTAAGVRYEDLVGAADAVLTKPGYGIVAECVANRTPMVYTPRGRFAEYPYLVAGIRRHLAHAEIGNEDLLAGRWSSALEAAWASRAVDPAPAVNGAEVAAAALSELR